MYICTYKKRRYEEPKGKTEDTRQWCNYEKEGRKERLRTQRSILKNIVCWKETYIKKLFNESSNKTIKIQTSVDVKTATVKDMMGTSVIIFSLKWLYKVEILKLIIIYHIYTFKFIRRSLYCCEHWMLTMEHNCLFVFFHTFTLKKYVSNLFTFLSLGTQFSINCIRICVE